MKKERTEKHFIKGPIYEGGLKALRLFIKDNLKYPEAAKANKIEGTVVVKYTINYKGEVIESKIMKGLGYGCDEEASRLTKLLRFKIPKTRKIKIQFHKSIQIHFILPKVKKTSIKYSYTSPVKKKSNIENTPDSGYHYTINF
jgi:TonB family protein